MAANRKLQDDLEELRADASKVLTDISRLTKNIPEATRDRAEQASKAAIENIQAEMGLLSQRMSDLSRVLKKQMSHADRHVHEKPYLYIAGAVGLGAVLGRSLLVRPRN